MSVHTRQRSYLRTVVKHLVASGATVLLGGVVGVALYAALPLVAPLTKGSSVKPLSPVGVAVLG